MELQNDFASLTLCVCRNSGFIPERANAMSDYRLPMLPPAKQLIQVMTQPYGYVQQRTAYQPPKPPRPPRALRPDVVLAQIFQGHVPSYHTAAGIAYCQLVAFERLHNGELGAVYETNIMHPTIGRRELTGYLWCVDYKTGQPKQLKGEAHYRRYM